MDRTDPGSAMKRLRLPRVSLATLLLLTALVATSITSLMLWVELVPLRQEVYRLRDEVGELVIRDETKLHAVQIPVEKTPTRREWRWRVWWPAGRAYRLHCKEGQIPFEGIPPGSGWNHVEGGAPVVVRYVETQDPESRQWTGRVSCQSTGYGSSADFRSTAVDWYSAPNLQTLVGGVTERTKLFDLDEPVVLHRFLVRADVTSTTIPELSDGLMIWLEPMP